MVETFQEIPVKFLLDCESCGRNSNRGFGPFTSKKFILLSCVFETDVLMLKGSLNFSHRLIHPFIRRFLSDDASASSVLSDDDDKAGRSWSTKASPLDKRCTDSLKMSFQLRCLPRSGVHWHPSCVVPPRSLRLVRGSDNMDQFHRRLPAAIFCQPPSAACHSMIIL